MPLTLYVDNDNRIKLSGLVDADGAYQNSATVTVTLLERDGTEVTGETWPLTMSYSSGSDGNYTAVLQDTLSVTSGQRLIARVSVSSGGLNAEWEEPVVAVDRA